MTSEAEETALMTLAEDSGEMKEAGEAEAASMVVVEVHRLLGVQGGPGMVAALTSDQVGIEEAMRPGAAEPWEELLAPAPAAAMVSRDVTAGTAIAPAALTSSRSQIQVSSLRQRSCRRGLG